MRKNAVYFVFYFMILQSSCFKLIVLRILAYRKILKYLFYSSVNFVPYKPIYLFILVLLYTNK